MSEKDKFNILSLLEAIDKIVKYTSHYDNPDNFIKMRGTLMLL